MQAAALGRPFGESAGTWLPSILRIGAAACFIGHGALGLRHTAAWIPYFAVVGVGRESALALMPWIGVVDVAVGLSALVYPIRAVVLYLAAWGAWTALLRPLAGEPVWEAIERAGNYGLPLALFLLAQGGGYREVLSGRRRRAIGWVLRLTTVLLLLGHGALQLIVRKPMFETQYALIGLHGAAVEPLAGGIECLLALAVLLKPTRWLLFAVVAWKLATEALCPLAGSPFWVFIEHGGSYAAPLALALLAPSWMENDFVSSTTSQPATPA